MWELLGKRLPDREKACYLLPWLDQCSQCSDIMLGATMRCDIPKDEKDKELKNRTSHTSLKYY